MCPSRYDLGTSNMLLCYSCCDIMIFQEKTANCKETSTRQPSTSTESMRAFVTNYEAVSQGAGKSNVIFLQVTWNPY